MYEEIDRERKGGRETVASTEQLSWAKGTQSFTNGEAMQNNTLF